MSKVFNNVERFCAKSQLFAFYGKLWYNIYRKYERDMNRKEVNRMLTKREQIMNMELSKDNNFIIKREYISKKSVIGFKENGNEILKEDNTKEMRNDRTIQKEQDRQFKDSERQFKENQNSKLNKVQESLSWDSAVIEKFYRIKKTSGGT